MRNLTRGFNVLQKSSLIFSYYVPLPKITEDQYRVFCFTFKKDCPEAWNPERVFSFMTNGVYETKIYEDIAQGNIFILDLTHISLGHLTRITPTAIKKLNSMTEKVYNDRQKASHLIYNGPGADIVLAMLKSAMRAKVRERVREKCARDVTEGRHANLGFRCFCIRITRSCTNIFPRKCCRRTMVGRRSRLTSLKVIKWSLFILGRVISQSMYS